mmetsp:Transcript_18474/g.28032  ORF Transcript_18474/g.28032 Transcript_18474/m.28032 type:complete len:98 (+) Transcript_18474:144-437(+)
MHHHLPNAFPDLISTTRNTTASNTKTRMTETFRAFKLNDPNFVSFSIRWLSLCGTRASSPSSMYGTIEMPTFFWPSTSSSEDTDVITVKSKEASCSI